MFARISFGVTEGVELFEIDVFKSGLFSKFTAGAVLNALFWANESSRESPLSFVGCESTFDEENFDVILIKAKDDAICSESWSRIFIAMRHDFLLVFFIHLSI